MVQQKIETQTQREWVSSEREENMMKYYQLMNLGEGYISDYCTTDNFSKSLKS